MTEISSKENNNNLILNKRKDFKNQANKFLITEIDDTITFLGKVLNSHYMLLSLNHSKKSSIIKLLKYKIALLKTLRTHKKHA